MVCRTQLIVLSVALLLSLCDSSLNSFLDFSSSGKTSADHWWAMRLALNIAQNHSRSSESTSMLQVRSSGSIPRILHTVVKNCSDPRSVQKLKLNRHVLLAYAADFQFRCYDDASMPDHVKNWLPQYADIFGRIPSNIARSDLFRYIAVWHEGGFHADDDVVILPGFLRGIAWSKANSRSFLVGWERRTPTVSLGGGCKEHYNVRCSIGEKECMLCNSLAQWTFGAERKHPLFLDLVQQVVDYFDHPLIKKLSDTDVLHYTGPVMFSTRVLMHQQPSDVLGIEAFGCGQSHSNSPLCDPANETIWSQHLFEGKWRTESGSVVTWVLAIGAAGGGIWLAACALACLATTSFTSKGEALGKSESAGVVWAERQRLR